MWDEMLPENLSNFQRKLDARGVEPRTRDAGDKLDAFGPALSCTCLIAAPRCVSLHVTGDFCTRVLFILEMRVVINVTSLL